VGSDKQQKADVRIVAATNRDMEEEVRTKRFREDLFYRLAVERIFLPPLRQHKVDLEFLWDHLTLKFLKPGAVVPKLTYEALCRLRIHDWPGNVRELRNVIQRALSARPEGSAVIDFEHLLFDEAEKPASPTEHLVDVVGRTLEETQRRAFELTLVHCKGNRSRTARMLGVSRGMVRRHLGLPFDSSDEEPVAGDNE
jgi:transcriptional regulator with PAS, ATPase and Fis domain